MSARSTALLRVVTGHGIIPRKPWLERLLTMLDVRRTRIDLSRLSDDHLRDIGLTRDDVEAEIARPLWDVPRHWRR
ncbi:MULTISPECIES: DUF1127 domain-containing protein [Paracoccus]|uniref:DUF1127 domain-containing protein n=1 Tax=Paracoccus hibiscisoli TaxID=2023261 RepID=A0A4U0QQA3_9RHOB|nr:MULTISPECIES: DUF1127 domain-containing protein [Paracoccus]ODT60944.1 MAG: hypothetical protein ABS73_03650 [Paracoccus sp. SCN 68-21]TJZ83700.1 DUF1127 domain-containing protein [Paracoccus hibiscisoli]